MKLTITTASGEKLRLNNGNRIVAEYRRGPPPPPAARIFIVSPTGTSGGEGTLGAPWSLDHALDQVVPGDTIQLRGGRYRKAEGWTLSRSGTVDDPITITRYPNETPILDGAEAGPVNTPTTSWEVYDADRSIYRSTFTVPTSDVEWDGFIALGTDPDDYTQWHTLVPYKSYAYLAADTHLYSGTAAYYLGPGIFHDKVTHRLFVRLVNSTPESQQNRTVTQIPDPDPRNNKLHLSRSRYYAFDIRGDYNRIVNVGIIQSFYGCYQIVDTVTTPTIGFEAHNNEGHPHYFVLKANFGQKWKLLGGTYDGHVNMESHWVSWVDYKNGVLAAQNMRKLAIDLGKSEIFEIGPSPGTGNTVWFPTPDGATPITFRGFFDGISGNGHGTADELAKVHGVLFSHIMDDAWQRVAPIYRTEMYDFICEGAGPSRDAAGSANPNAIPGTNYIHHGRIIGKRAWWYRKGHPTDVSNIGYRETIPMSTHGSLVTYSSPLKIWNVDILVGISGAPRASTYGGNFGRFGGLKIAEATDERYNNILYWMDDRPLGRDTWTENGGEIYDGNLYWGWTTANIWVFFHTSAGDVTVKTRQDIWSAAANDSQVYYPPGWEAAGIQIDPQFDANWDPQSPDIHVGAVNLSSKGWPNTVGYVPHRGAKRP